MVDTVQIKISGESGYVNDEEVYKDTLIITDHSIEYECKPNINSEMNPVQSWSYTTNSPAFKKLFELGVVATHEIFARDPQCPGTDMPVTRFQVTYSNKEIAKKVYMVNSNEFSECFSILKKMVPPCELMPSVLQTFEDYKKRRLWHDILSR